MTTLAHILLALLAASAFPLHAAETDLKCEKLSPAFSGLKVMLMQPRRRAKEWLADRPNAVFQTACDKHGYKTEESESGRSGLISRRRYLYKSREDAGRLCKDRKSEEKLTTTFSEDARSQLDDFCRENRKRDFDVVFVLDALTGTAAPVRQIFRLYTAKGLLAEEYEFDMAAGLEARTGYTYDPKNSLARKTEYAPDGRRLRREDYSSDNTAASRTVTLLDENDQPEKKTIYEYREDGTLRRETVTAYDAGGQELSRNEILYGGKGGRKTERVFQGDPPKPVYEYRYSHKLDKHGNWIEERKVKLLLYDNKPFGDPKTPPDITRREITYYQP
jgi:hypothetical protein